MKETDKDQKQPKKKRAKKNHLGVGLNDIIKNQENVEVNMLEEAFEEYSMHDIVTGEALEDWKTENNEEALTIYEDIDEVIEKLSKISKSEKNVDVKIHEKDVDKLRKNLKILNKKDFDTFVFQEKEDQFEIVIKKDKTISKKENLETVFLDIITQISDVNQFI